MDDMFDSSNNEVFTAIEGRVVEAGAEEDKPEGAKAIEADQGSDTMKKLFLNVKFLSQSTLRRRTREIKGKTESIKV